MGLITHIELILQREDNGTMSTGWMKSGLTVGEELTLPDFFFEAPDIARQRIESCVYIGETETGIIVEVTFKPTFFNEGENGSRVRKFIDFAAMYCGLVQLKRKDRSTLRIERRCKRN